MHATEEWQLGCPFATTTAAKYTSDAFQNKLLFLSTQSSPSFGCSPEGNGGAERFIRTRKEQLLWVLTFATAKELRRALLGWAHRYNERWLLDRHNFLSPRQARRELMQKQAAKPRTTWCLNNRKCSPCPVATGSGIS